ncbi:MAG: CRISPR-associated protein Cas4 [Anaerorhabdus sp.]
MKEYVEDDYLMLSGIQHFAFCRRQWALIHIEQQWNENIHTTIGELFHEKAHDSHLKEKRKNIITTRGMPVYSKTLGISGNCDIIEFYDAVDGITLHGHKGLFKVYPIEYKKGKPKDTDIDILQLTAQAMCLEEMLITEITDGAIYYGETHRRNEITFTSELREKVCDSLKEMHQMFEKQYTPKVKWSKKCSACSLKNLCIPKLTKVNSVKSYITKKITDDGDEI